MSPISLLELDEAASEFNSSLSNNKAKTFMVPSSKNEPQSMIVVSPPSSSSSSSSSSDLHRNVINLTEEPEEPSAKNQSDNLLSPCDQFFQRSKSDAFLRPSFSNSSSLHLVDVDRNNKRYDINTRSSGVILGLRTTTTTTTTSSTSCFGKFSGEMQSGTGGQQIISANNSNLSNSQTTNCDNGLNINKIQTDSSLNAANIVGLPSSQQHTRYSSAPYANGTNFQNNGHHHHHHTAAVLTGSQQNVQHFRNVSEPSQQQFFRYNNNNNNATHQQVVPFLHYPPSQQNPQQQGGGSIISTNKLDQQNNLQLINHFRSSSVPKSMTLVPKYDVSAGNSVRIKGTQVLQNIYNNNDNRCGGTSSATDLSMNDGTIVHHQNNAHHHHHHHQNVSNVNVNFYRAVPVNVVSSVPTIHCLNTLSGTTTTTTSQGNNVSNVQVLPLTNNNTPIENSHSHHQQVTINNINPIRVPVSSSTVNIQNSSTIFSTTDEVPSSSSSSAVINNNFGRIINTTAQINHNNNNISSGTGTTITNNNNNNNGAFILNPIVRTRTFTSTEAQTDEILPVISTTRISTIGTSIHQHQQTHPRGQRRRERRERRQNRKNNSNRTNDNSTQAGNASTGTVQSNSEQDQRLPDILNSHLPPPYSTLPQQLNQCASASSMVPPPPHPPLLLPHQNAPPGTPVLQTVVQNGMSTSAFIFSAPPQQMAPLMPGGAPVPVAVPASAAGGFRFGFPSANGFRRSRFSDDTHPKGCCGFLTWKPGSLRWFIALIALIAVCCVLVGTALGAMRPAGRDHLTVSLLMIGVGIVLITVSGVAWRLTSHDSSTCRSMLGLGSTESVDVSARRFFPRLPPSYGRPHHPYAAMMYPEFQYRPPPPSYQASMQEYRLRLLLLDRGGNNGQQIQSAGLHNAISPPPTYRSHAGSLLRAPLSSRREMNQSEYSCPPSYRSQNSSNLNNNRPGTLTNGSILHSRDPSLTISESNQESVANVVNILGSAEEDIALDNITLDSLKIEPSEPAVADISPLKMLLKGSQNELEGLKDGNLVTIVQTNEQSPVIVTVSGSSAHHHHHENHSTVQITEIPSEMEILAHL